MTATPPATPADDLDMRAVLDDTMAKMGAKTTPLSAPAISPAATARPPLTQREQLIGAGLGLLLLIIASILWGRWQAATTAEPPPAATSAAQPATPNPQRPTPSVVMIDAYGAPNEAPRWQIEATRQVTPVAHYGADWIQAQVEGSGLIWLRADDWPQLALGGPDLKPRPATAAAPQRAIATPEPPPCHTAGLGDQTITVCDWLSPADLEAAAAAQWAATYGGTVGSGDIHPTIQPFLTTPPNSSLEARQRLIGSDPAALACQNAQGQASPLCGGLTNAEAQAALSAERAKGQP